MVLEILLIEDNPDHAFLVSKALRAKADKTVDIVTNGEEALQRIEKKKYDLVLSDYNLPGRNGLEILQEIKKRNIDVPFVMLTGAGDEKLAVSAMQAGAYNYIVKDQIYLTIISKEIEETMERYRGDKERERLQKEIREKNIALEKANAELRKLDELKSDFIASVSHEFRTPLNSMKESFALILDGIVNPQDEKGKRVLNIGQNSVNRLTLLINDLLDFSKLEAGKMRMEKAAYKLDDIVNEVVDSLKALANKKKITLSYLAPNQLTKIFVDKDRIIQVLTNLVDNAIKFTPKDEQINIRAERLPGEMLKVIVQDTGIGIPQEDLERIFEKFEQVKKSPVTTELKGTGLGLSISKQIIELHNGKIWAESEVGKGSKFIFTLPLYV